MKSGTGMDFSSVINEKIISSLPVSGGDIGRSFRVKTSSRDYFVKYYSRPGLSVLEAKGLSEMAEAGSVSLPELVGFDDHLLALVFIEQAPRTQDFQSQLGRELARMHKADVSEQFGFPVDNFIGSTPQKNSFKSVWCEFFIENRIDYQIEISGDRNLFDSWKQLRPLVPELLAGTEEPPSLIHGDLWSGNVISGKAGEPVLIDPAAYYGHREMELGMTRLFGGFTEEFYSAYDAEYPLKPNWRSRMNLYILYHVLNHFNMFAGGYRSQALSLMRGYL